MRPSYIRWRADLTAILDDVEQSVRDFGSQAASASSGGRSVASTCSAFASSASDLMGPPDGVFQLHNFCRSIGRELTYRGFDYELALTDTTVFKLIGLDNFATSMKSQMASPDIVDVKPIMCLNSSSPCGPGGADVFPWGYDRIGLQLKVFTSSPDPFTLLVNFGVSVSGTVLSLERFRDPKFCLSDSIDPVLKTNIEDKVKSVLDSSAFAKSVLIPLKQDPLSSDPLAMYTEQVSPFLSLFSKRLSGRHARLSPLQYIPSGWDAAIGIHPNVIRDRVKVELDKASKTLVIDYRPTFDLALQGNAITLNPNLNSIDFDAQYYVVQLGGGGGFKLVDPEWVAVGWGVYKMRAVLTAIGNVLGVTVTKLGVKEYHAALYLKSDLTKVIALDSIPVARDKIKDSADQPIDTSTTIKLGDAIQTTKVVVVSDRLILYVAFRNI